MTTDTTISLSDFLLAREQQPNIRAIIEDHTPYGGFQQTESWHDDQNRCSTCTFVCTFDTATGPLPEPELRRVRYPCLTLRNVAIPHSADPLFRDDWKVDES